ncbi:MAG: phosphotransferase, partial [Planctomycetes bacterium]|nr:phosphotransferase [Planctomycetota bacterium]
TAQAAIAARLLAAGIVHRDLHADNFVALADGEVAVLDLQSASVADRRLDDTPHRLAAAARLVRDLPAAAADALREGGLLTTAAEVAEVVARAAHARARYARSRVRRCLTESTEFRRRVRWHGVEHSFRGSWPAGRWIRGGRELDECWLGQNANRLFGSRSPVFWAFFRKWWWLGGGRALYVPEACREAGLEQEIAVARSGFAVPGGRMQSEGANQDGD